MQIALVDMQRRVQGRVPLPWIQADPAWLVTQQREGRPLVRFGDIPLEWSDFRLTLRQTADILRRFDALEAAEHEQIVAIGRDGNALEPIVSGWYNASSGVQAEHCIGDFGAASARWRTGEPRAGARARDPTVPRALRGSDDAACGPVGVDPRSLPVLRLGAGFRGDHAERRPPADLRPLCGAVVLRCASRARSARTTTAR